MNVLCGILAIALAVSWIYFVVSKKRQAPAPSVQQITEKDAPTSIEQRDDELIVEALGRMTEAEYAEVQRGNTSVLTEMVNAIKRERIPDYDFKVAQYLACLTGAKAARKDHLQELREGEPYGLAAYDLERSEKLQAKANRLRQEIDIF